MTITFKSLLLLGYIYISQQILKKENNYIIDMGYFFDNDGWDFLVFYILISTFTTYFELIKGTNREKSPRW